MPKMSQRNAKRAAKKAALSTPIILTPYGTVNSNYPPELTEKFRQEYVFSDTAVNTRYLYTHHPARIYHYDTEELVKELDKLEKRPEYYNDYLKNFRYFPQDHTDLLYCVAPVQPTTPVSIPTSQYIRHPDRFQAIMSQYPNIVQYYFKANYKLGYDMLQVLYTDFGIKKIHGLDILAGAYINGIDWDEVADFYFPEDDDYDNDDLEDDDDYDDSEDEALYKREYFDALGSGIDDIEEDDETLQDYQRHGELLRKVMEIFYKMQEVELKKMSGS